MKHLLLLLLISTCVLCGCSSNDDADSSKNVVVETQKISSTPKPNITTISEITVAPTNMPTLTENPYYELDALQRLYISINKDMSYTECVDYIKSTSLPYSEEKYNGSRVIQVAFTDACTAQSYMDESGDYLTITYCYPRDENSSNDVLEKYYIEYCEYVPIESDLTLTYIFSDNCYGYKEKGSYIKRLGEELDFDTSYSRESQFEYYFQHKGL